MYLRTTRKRWSLKNASCLFVLVAAAILTIPGCKKEAPASPDAALVLPSATGTPSAEPAQDAGQAPTDATAGEAEERVEGEAAGGEAEDERDSSPESAGQILEEGSRVLARAVGKAPKGRDISLARDRAANRAREKLLKLLEEKGYETEAPGKLEGATIKRFWKKGRFMYAEAEIALPSVPGKLNHLPAAPSKNTEGKPTEEKNAP